MNSNIIFFIYGAPEKEEDVPEFLKRILGEKLKEEILESSLERYKICGGASPQIPETRKQIEKIKNLLEEDGIKASFHLVTRFWEPSPEKVLPALRNKRALLYPGTLIQCKETVKPYLSIAEKFKIKTSLPAPLHREGDIIKYLGKKLKGNTKKEDIVIFTAHSVPSSKTGLEYREEFFSFAKSIAEEANIKDFITSFQSTPQYARGWLSPDINEIIYEILSKFKDKENFVFLNLNFLTDNMETLYDLDYVIKKKVEFRGFKYSRVPQLGEDEGFMKIIAKQIKNYILEGSAG